MSREKKPVLRGIDQAKYENALAEYATKSAQESKLLAEMEIKMTAIKTNEYFKNRKANLIK